jgi:hypothetical protein
MPWLFGLKLGDQFVAPLCNAGSPPQGQPRCVMERAAAKGAATPFSGSAQVRFRSGEIQPWVRYGAVRVEIAQGRLERLWVVTTREFDQADVARELVQRFGKPTSTTSIPSAQRSVELGGAEFEWVAAPYRMTFRANVGGDGEGTITLATWEGERTFKARQGN